MLELALRLIIQPVRLPVDPDRQVNPPGDLVEALALPGTVLRQIPAQIVSHTH